ncbi:hypothetical protein B0T11DRAFT_128321 [Plectosphaerella cucumerina]|uniref:Uncharacterized protein n=1 Tax=Plectosphaerella cucumerina TaxID=40658 RepID=A0A8K0X0V9_9PEZI|nr:hypothetical protein B0T11DRAFT_128321 [Plectosphaerella cucumerina]
MPSDPDRQAHVIPATTRRTRSRQWTLEESGLWVWMVVFAADFPSETDTTAIDVSFHLHTASRRRSCDGKSCRQLLGPWNRRFTASLAARVWAVPGDENGRAMICEGVCLSGTGASWDTDAPKSPPRACCESFQHGVANGGSTMTSSLRIQGITTPVTGHLASSQGINSLSTMAAPEPRPQHTRLPKMPRRAAISVRPLCTSPSPGRRGRGDSQTCPERG